MKVLLIHNHYRLAGGEDGVVKAEQSLLKANGHQVSLLEVSNHDIKNTWDKVATAIILVQFTHIQQNNKFASKFPNSALMSSMYITFFLYSLLRYMMLVESMG